MLKLMIIYSINIRENTITIETLKRDSKKIIIDRSATEEIQYHKSSKKEWETMTTT